MLSLSGVGEGENLFKPVTEASLPALHCFSSILCVSFGLLWFFNVGFARIFVESGFTTDDWSLLH